LIYRVVLFKIKQPDFSIPKKFSMIALSRQLPFLDMLCFIPFPLRVADIVAFDIIPGLSVMLYWYY
jgi:hypothetical protein